MRVKFDTPGYIEDKKAPVKNYLTRRDRYELFGQSDKIEEPIIPDDGDYLWDAFWSLSRRRQQGFNGPQPLSFSEVGYWLALKREQLSPPEVDILIAMDDAFLSSIEQEREDQRAANDGK